MSPEMIKAKLKDLNPKPTITEEEVEVLARENAAIKIQRAWRAKKRASYLDTDFLWTDLVTRTRFKVRVTLPLRYLAVLIDVVSADIRWIGMPPLKARIPHVSGGGGLYF
jgi:hypothetical protein